ncbi:MAG: hypothetical protein V1865_00455 [bacterium]
MSKRKKTLIILIITIIGIILAITIFKYSKDERNKKEKIFSQMLEKNNIIDLIELKPNDMELPRGSNKLYFFNQKIKEITNFPIKVLVTSKTNFSLAIFIHSICQDMPANISIVKLEKGLNLDNFHPEFKQFNPNKVKETETFQITPQALKYLKKRLEKIGVKIFESKEIGEWIYII